MPLEKAAVPPAAAGWRSGIWLLRTLIPDIKASRLSPIAAAGEEAVGQNLLGGAYSGNVRSSASRLTLTFPLI